MNAPRRLGRPPTPAACAPERAQVGSLTSEAFEVLYRASWPAIVDYLRFRIGPAEAVGSNTAHFDGLAWRAVDRRDVDGELQAVGVLPSGYGWVVGDNEEVVPIRDGIAGASVHIPGYRFKDVAVVAEDAVWALAMPAKGRRAGHPR